jgi:hypothetical protein
MIIHGPFQIPINHSTLLFFILSYRFNVSSESFSILWIKSFFQVVKVVSINQVLYSLWRSPCPLMDLWKIRRHVIIILLLLLIIINWNLRWNSLIDRLRVNQVLLLILLLISQLSILLIFLLHINWSRLAWLDIINTCNTLYRRVIHRCCLIYRY